MRVYSLLAGGDDDAAPREALASVRPFRIASSTGESPLPPTSHNGRLFSRSGSPLQSSSSSDIPYGLHRPNGCMMSTFGIAAGTSTAHWFHRTSEAGATVDAYCVFVSCRRTPVMLHILCLATPWLGET